MSLRDFIWEAFGWACLLALAVIAVVCLTGCVNTREATEAQRLTRTVTVTKAQTISPQGEIVELTTRTTTTTDETTGQTTTGATEIEPPKILGKLAGLAGTALGGPVAGAAVQQATDWLTTTVVGGGAAALASGTGWAAIHRPQAARRRKLEEELAELEEERDAADAKARRAEDAQRRSEEALRHLTRGIQKWKDAMRAADGPENPAIASLHDYLEKSTDDESRKAIRQVKATI